MHGVYVLRSKKDFSLYIGYSHDVATRWIQHQKGNVPSTKNKRPLEVLYCELYKERLDAMRREKFFKTGWGRNYLKKILHYSLKS